MPLWAVILLLGIAVSMAGFTLKYLIENSHTLGSIEQLLIDNGRRLGIVEAWQRERDGEIVAHRNDYQPRPREWWR